MGVDGQRVDATEMAARQYSMFINDRHVIVEIPIGAVGGYFKVGGLDIYLILNLIKRIICHLSSLKISTLKSNLFN